MKKAIAGAVLAGLTLRLAVLAGAGDVLAGWVQALAMDSRAVTAALTLELGAPAGGELRDVPAPAEAESGRGDAGGPTARSPEPPAGEALPEELTEPAPEPAETELPVTAAVSLAENVTLHNRTSFSVDAAALAAEGPGLSLTPGEPQVLIIHTHSSEAYTQDEYDRYEASDPYRTEDRRYSVIRVGDVLTERLEAHGLTVLHDREIYDYPSYTGSYTRSGAAVEKYLAAYPSLRVVFDVHRDAIGSGDTVYKTLATLDGRASAQVMLLVGTGENGLSHPNWRENLKLAIYLQGAADSQWPGLTRPIEVVSERYNQQLSAGSLILEVGSTGNTLREAVAAAELFGDAAGEALAACLAPEF